MLFILIILLINFILLLFLLFKAYAFSKKFVFDQLMFGTIVLIALITLCEIEIVRASPSYIIPLLQVHATLIILIIFLSVNSIWTFKNYHSQKNGLKQSPFKLIAYLFITCCLIFEFYRSGETAFIIKSINGFWTYKVIYTHHFNWFFSGWLVLSISMLSFFTFKAYLKTSSKNKKLWMWRLMLSLTILPLGMLLFFFLFAQTPKYFLFSPLMMLCVYAWMSVKSNFKLFENSPHMAMNNILKTIPSIIVILDIKCRIRYINYEGEQILGMKQKDLFNRSIFDISNSLQVDLCTKAEIASIKKDNLLNKEVIYMGKYFFDLKILPVFNKRQIKTGYLIVGHDISSFRLEEQERIRAYNLLKQSNQELERFAYIASHDLKTPLRNIVSFVNLMERAIKKEDYQVLPEYMDYLKMYSSNMFNLVQDVLEMSKVNNQDLKLKDIDMNNIIHMVKNNLHDRLSSSNAKVIHQTLPIIRANGSQMLQLFQNLVENGIKYNKSDSPTVWIDYIDIPHFHQFSIKDNGIGIDQAYHKKIFEMFQRLHSISEYEGSGIGLALCKKIIEAHRGNILLESPEEGGIKVICQLPKKPLNKQQESSLTIAQQLLDQQ